MEIMKMINEDWNLSDQEFMYFRDLIEQIAGISLSSDKKELVKTRLRKYITSLKLDSFEGYLTFLSQLPTESPYWQEFVNLLTTNKTDFFREPKHFDYLIYTFLPEWLKTDQKVLNIWSCASSSGEEAYTLAMLLKKHMPSDRDFRILATDIDTEMIKMGANGVYPLSKLIEIPEQYQAESLVVGTGDVSGWFCMKSLIKEKVIFKHHNLMDAAEFADENSELNFDVIFCRNVLIYFSKEKVSQVVQNAQKKLKNKGLFFVGHSESLQGVGQEWKAVQPSVYKLAT